MPRGDKSNYTTRQKRQARHIEDSYEERGISPRTAKSRAWATVNAQDGGGKKSGPTKHSKSKSTKSRSKSMSGKKRKRSMAHS